MTDPIRVLLVDDHKLVRAGLQLILEAERDIEVVGEAEHGADAIAMVAETRPGVVCMDVQMPVMGGIEATSRIVRDHGADVRVLVLTTFRDDTAVRDALQAGASGFVLKNSPPETLIEAIRVVHQGDALLDPQVTRSVIAAAMTDRSAQARDAAVASGGQGAVGAPAAPAAPAAPPTLGAPAAPAAPGAGGPAATATPAGSYLASAPDAPATAPEPPALAQLTEREREVLLLLAEGLSNAEIAQQMYVSGATIKTHVSNLLAKLGVHDRIHAVIFAYEHGLVGPSAEAPRGPE